MQAATATTSTHSFHLVNGTAPTTACCKRERWYIPPIFLSILIIIMYRLKLKFAYPFLHRVQRQTSNRVDRSSSSSSYILHYLYICISVCVWVGAGRTHTAQAHITQMCLYLCLVTCDGTFKMTWKTYLTLSLLSPIDASTHTDQTVILFIYSVISISHTISATKICAQAKHRKLDTILMVARCSWLNSQVTFNVFKFTNHSAHTNVYVYRWARCGISFEFTIFGLTAIDFDACCSHQHCKKSAFYKTHYLTADARRTVRCLYIQINVKELRQLSCQDTYRINISWKIFIFQNEYQRAKCGWHFSIW